MVKNEKILKIATNAKVENISENYSSTSEQENELSFTPTPGDLSPILEEPVEDTKRAPETHNVTQNNGNNVPRINEKIVKSEPTARKEKREILPDDKKHTP